MITKKGKVYYKTNGKCSYCGEDLEPFGYWHMDHQFPKSRGGSDELDNLMPACKFCNSSKGNKTIDEWKQFLLKDQDSGTFVRFYYERFQEKKDYLDDVFSNYIEN